MVSVAAYTDHVSTGKFRGLPLVTGRGGAMPSFDSLARERFHCEISSLVQDALI